MENLFCSVVSWPLYLKIAGYCIVALMAAAGLGVYWRLNNPDDAERLGNDAWVVGKLRRLSARSRRTVLALFLIVVAGLFGLVGMILFGSQCISANQPSDTVTTSEGSYTPQGSPDLLQGHRGVTSLLLFSAKDGGTALVRVVVGYADAAFWRFKEPVFNKPEEMEDFLESKGVRDIIQNNLGIVCVGLASAIDSHGREDRELELSQNRARVLCEAVAKKGGINPDTRPMFYFGLGRFQGNRKQAMEEDDPQRPIVLIAVEQATGSLLNEEARNAMITAIIRRGYKLGFYPREYYVVKEGKELKWFQLGRVVDSDRGSFRPDTAH